MMISIAWLLLIVPASMAVGVVIGFGLLALVVAHRVDEGRIRER